MSRPRSSLPFLSYPLDLILDFPHTTHAHFGLDMIRHCIGMYYYLMHLNASSHEHPLVFEHKAYAAWSVFFLVTPWELYMVPE